MNRGTTRLLINRLFKITNGATATCLSYVSKASRVVFKFNFVKNALMFSITCSNLTTSMTEFVKFLVWLT